MLLGLLAAGLRPDEVEEFYDAPEALPRWRDFDPTPFEEPPVDANTFGFPLIVGDVRGTGNHLFEIANLILFNLIFNTIFNLKKN